MVAENGKLLSAFVRGAENPAAGPVTSFLVNAVRLLTTR
jgi:hypothetical protein